MPWKKTTASSWTNLAIRIAQVVDGTSHTALFSEAIRGDANDNNVEIFSDLFQLGNGSGTATAAQAYQKCTALTPGTFVGSSNQTSYAGRDWINGNYMTTRYNHLMLPNTWSCPRGNSPNDNGGATTASSRHMGGVNLALADGSVRFVTSDIDLNLWQGLGSRNGKEILSGDF